MIRSSLLLFPLALACLNAKPTDYSTDMVVLDRGQVIQTMKMFVAGPKSRLEGMSAGPLGRIVTIVRRDRGVTWTLYPDKHQYTERALSDTRQGKLDLSNFDLANMKQERLGRETVLGYPCTKMRVTAGTMPNGQPLTSIVWVADSLDLPIRLETMGFVQENRNLKVGPQPQSLFEIPAGYTRTNAPGRPDGIGTRPPITTGTAARRYDDRKDRVTTPTVTSSGPAWTLNTNYPGGDFRSIDMATSDPTPCKAACDKDARCKAWTLVTPTEPGGMGYCWLKDSVPELVREECCISGLKGAGGAATGQTTSSKYKLEMDINRYGDDYRDFIPAAASAEPCAEACEKDARCKAWTWVKAELEGPSGHCWLKNRIPEASHDTCCVSGVRR